MASTRELDVCPSLSTYSAFPNVWNNSTYFTYNQLLGLRVDVKGKESALNGLRSKNHKNVKLLN